VFRSADGLQIGTADTKLGSLEPSVQAFPLPEQREAAAQLALGTGGALPFDPTLGNAQKAAAIEETWWQHVQKGGPIMYPMAVLAGAALLVVLGKWLSMLFVRRPARRSVEALLQAVRKGDRNDAIAQAETIGGPAGEMLQAGAEHLGEPRELIEEVMYERVLSTRLRLNGWLPFVAICATSAPLLGLLGTVTGIMNTFNQMTVYGTGDPKTLSGGISEALITTEYGLIIAIPSLLLHAFLSRRARSITDELEKLALKFLAEMRKAETAAASRQAIEVA
jgi:biopolymer transport protein ExbB